MKSSVCNVGKGTVSGAGIMFDAHHYQCWVLTTGLHLAGNMANRVLNITENSPVPDTFIAAPHRHAYASVSTVTRERSAS